MMIRLIERRGCSCKSLRVSFFCLVGYGGIEGAWALSGDAGVVIAGWIS